jgi:hypothetical protein
MRYEDLYGAVIYLASRASDFVTGHNLVIDGGYTLNTWITPLPRKAPARSSIAEEEAGLQVDLGNQKP